MNALAFWDPGDQVVIWGVNVLWQVTLLTVIVLAIAKSMRRNPALRYSVLCSSLLLVLLTPAIAFVIPLSGRSLLSLSLPHEVVVSASDGTGEEMPMERQAFDASSVPSPLGDVDNTPHRANEMWADGPDSFGHAAPRAATLDRRISTGSAATSPPEDAIPASLAPRLTTTWIGKTLRYAMPPLLLVWLTGAVLLLGRLGIAWCRLEVILRSVKRNTDPSLTRWLGQAGRTFHFTRMPELVLSQRVSAPASAGLFRPRIVLPPRVVDGATPQQLCDVFVHELAHIMRRDQLVVLLQNIAAAVFWLHPLIRALNRQLGQAREEVCDNYVLTARDAPAYSRTLLTLAELLPNSGPLPGVAGLFTSRWKLERRIADLLDERRSRRIRPTSAGKVFVVVVSLVMGTIAVLGTMTLAVGQTDQSDSTADSRNTTVAHDTAKGTRMPPTSANDSSGTLLSMRGRVTGPDGQPARAQLWIGGPPRPDDVSPSPQTIEWRLVSQVGDDGRFEIGLDLAKLGWGQTTEPQVKIRLAATADELGYAWADVKIAEPQDNITLQLVKDLPIEGRILTPEGQPARGVKITISQVYAPRTTIDVDELVKWAPSSSGVYTKWPSWPGGGPTSKPLLTDADGRFRLKGMGAGRFVRLEAFGRGIGATRLSILTQATPSNAGPGGVIAVREGLRESSYFATFTHIAMPGRTLRGVVTDAATGDPLAGVRVTANSSWASRKNPATTGEDGRYEITGVAKAKEYWLELEPTKSLHFNKKLKVADPPGLEPIDVDTALVKGIRVGGRVTDAESGEAVRGTVFYNPLFPNVHVSQLSEQSNIARPAASAVLDADGSYEISVLPGPGALAVETEDKSYVSAAVDADRLKEITGRSHVAENDIGEVLSLMTAAGGQSRGIMGVRAYQAVILVNPPDNSDAMTLDVTVVPSRSRPGTIVDEQGLPRAGVQVIGLGASGTTVTEEPLESAQFSVEGLSPGRRRRLLFLHPERELGAHVVVTGDEITPIRVHLSPTGTITGRFVDQFGAALPDVRVKLMPATPTLLLIPGFWEAEADENGRFRITGLIQDVSFRLDAYIPQQGMSLFVQGNVSAASGETVDLGAFTQQNEHRFMPVGKKESRK